MNFHKVNTHQCSQHWAQETVTISLEDPSCLLPETTLHPPNPRSAPKFTTVTSNVLDEVFLIWDVTCKLCLYSLCLATFIWYVCEIGPCGCTSFLCNISLYEYSTLSVCLWVFCTFGQLWRVLLWASLHMSSVEQLLIFLSGLYLGGELLGYRGHGFCRYYQFSKVAQLIYTLY